MIQTLHTEVEDNTCMPEDKGSGHTNPSYNYNSLLLFKPRQVVLAETKMAATKDQSLDRKTIMAHLFCRYLHTHGFSKTLKRFLSEAQVQDDNWRTSSVDLEDKFFKYLETRGDADTKVNSSKEKESLINGVMKKDENGDHSASMKTTSKKKKRNIDDEPMESDKNLEDVLSNDRVSEVHAKPKEKKKSKRVSDSNGQAEQISSEALTKPADDTVGELQVDGSNKKQKDKKKNKKSTSEPVVGNLEKTEDKSKDVVSSEGDNKFESEEKAKSKDRKKKNKGVIADKLVTDSMQMEEKDLEPKDKKRKKKGSIPEKSLGDDVELLPKDNAVLNDSKNEILHNSEDVRNKEKKASKKRKRLASKEGEQSVEEVAIEDSKRQKTEDLGEAKITKKTSEEPTNGKLEKNGEEKSALQKSTRKQTNGSAEPKTVNAFQRVKLDDVEFANEKLQDNSYWAKDGAEIGYGAKAQEVLGQVRGRDFRHEKTKKKRGSYRGGNIDLQSHSVKFNYSDED